MLDGPWIERSYEEPYLTFRCDCGWEGNDVDVTGWEVQRENDRAVRRCPACGTCVPQWGSLRSLEGTAQVAHGALRDALVAAGVVDE